VLQAVHGALVSVDVPEADRFHRVLELSHEDFRFDNAYPDVQGSRTDDFVLIEIVLSAGRSVKVKKQFLANLMASLAAAGHNPENAMVVFKETTWENWAFAGGRQVHV
jgi:phenylpyruvate tautomerase PptA (4-oxalocrotonate tautomerase family)